MKTYGEQQVNAYIDGTSKPELDRYVNNEKKQVLDNYTAEKKSELDNYTATDKKHILDNYTENEKKAELDSHTAGLKEQLNAHTVAKTGELNEYTTGLKSELDGYTTAKEQVISEFTEQKKTEVQGVYQNDLNELKGDLGDVEDRIAPIDFRQKSIGEVILDVDVTGTMEALMDVMEQEPNEAIALTLEPDVPTAESHNFGVRGQICIDSNYLYVCTSLNTWKKISLLNL